MNYYKCVAGDQVGALLEGRSDGGGLNRARSSRADHPNDKIGGNHIYVSDSATEKAII